MPEIKKMKTFEVSGSRILPHSIEIQLLAKYLGKSETEILGIFPEEEVLELLRRTEILIEHLGGSENELLERFETVPKEENRREARDFHTFSKKGELKLIREEMRQMKRLVEDSKVQQPLAESAELTPTDPHPSKPANSLDSLRIRDAGLFSYIAGILGAAIFMALALGPGWLGFIIAFLPASALAAWEVTLHD